MKRPPFPRLAALIACCAAPAAWAAGGHHAVDDAAVLEPGQCEVESWASRARAAGTLLHAGAACGVGPLQLGAAGEHVRAGGTSSHGGGVEVKWAMELAEGWSLGASLQPAWQARVHPRYQGAALLALATWAPDERWAVHANLGREFMHREPDTTRGGVALEWSPARAWSLLAERFREQDTHFARGGVRYAAGESWSLDFSRAQRLSGPAPSSWTLGFSFVFDR